MKKIIIISACVILSSVVLAFVLLGMDKPCTDEIIEMLRSQKKTMIPPTNQTSGSFTVEFEELEQKEFDKMVKDCILLN